MMYDAQFIADVLGAYVAQSSDGVWRWYAIKPESTGSSFYSQNGETGILPPGLLGRVGNWKESLRAPGLGISVPANAMIMQKALDFKVRSANRIDGYLQTGYQLCGDVIERNGKFYHMIVKLEGPVTCPLSGYRVVMANTADGFLESGWTLASEPFYRSDGELFVEMVKRGARGQTK